MADDARHHHAGEVQSGAPSSVATRIEEVVDTSDTAINSNNSTARIDRVDEATAVVVVDVTAGVRVAAAISNAVAPRDALTHIARRTVAAAAPTTNRVRTPTRATALRIAANRLVRRCAPFSSSLSHKSRPLSRVRRNVATKFTRNNLSRKRRAHSLTNTKKINGEFCFVAN